MEHSPSWEANQFSASQEIPHILWNPKVHYRIHKCPPPVPILRQLDQSIHPHPTSWRSVLIFSFHLRLGLPRGLFPSSFPTNTLYTPVLSPIRATFPAHLILLDLNVISITVLLITWRNKNLTDVLNGQWAGHSLLWLAKGSVAEIRAYFLRCRLQPACRTQPALLAVGVGHCACRQSGRCLVVHPVMAPMLRCGDVCPTKSYVNLPCYRQTYIKSCGGSFAPTRLLNQLQPPVNLKLNPLAPELFFFNFSTSCI